MGFKIDTHKTIFMATKVKENGVQVLENTKAIHSLSMKAKYEHGHGFQNQVYDWFEQAGFIGNFFTVNDGLADRRADYQYNGVWVEAKTYIGDSDLTKILRLKPFLDEQNVQMVIMCEFTPESKEGKAHKKNIKHLIKNKIPVFQGPEECIGYIILEKTQMGLNKEIRMAKGVNIPLHLLVPNPDNRDLVIPNGPVINKSIKENGFFTQLNVVPHQLNADGEMTYMLFEGHNRLSQLLELKEKGYSIPPVACSLVDWVTSKDIEILHKLLILSNTSSKNWKLRDYVKSNLLYFTRLNFPKRIKTYQLLMDWIKEAKKKKWGETTPLYVFAHYDDMKFANMDTIKNGTFEIDENEYQQTDLLLFNMINELCDKLNSPINGSLVRQILVEAKVRKNNDPEFARVFKKYLEFVSDYITTLVITGISLPSDKNTVNDFIKKMNNSFSLKKFI